MRFIIASICPRIRVGGEEREERANARKNRETKEST